MESDSTIICRDTLQPDKSCVTDDWRKAMLSVETVYDDAPVLLPHKWKELHPEAIMTTSVRQLAK